MMQTIGRDRANRIAAATVSFKAVAGKPEGEKSGGAAVDMHVTLDQVMSGLETLLRSCPGPRAVPPSEAPTVPPPKP
jgi:hypothetical protein